LFRELNLCGNKLGNEAAATVFRTLPSVPSLTVLDLSNNGIFFEKRSIEALCQGMVASPNLKVIGLAGNRLTEEGGKAIWAALQQAKQVTHMSVDAMISRDTYKSIRTLLKARRPVSAKVSHGTMNTNTHTHTHMLNQSFFLYCWN
jgi:Ran GTPase-activating protein (RanGAP) involved in mRNA processing and transport